MMVSAPLWMPDMIAEAAWLDKIVPANPTSENLAALDAAMKAKTDSYARVVGRLEAPCGP
jgi:hypothetical protein